MGTVYPTTKSSANDVLSALPAKFETAKSSGELFFFPSSARDFQSEGRRVSQSLSTHCSNSHSSMCKAK